MPVPAIISGLFGIGKTFLDHRREKSQAKHERKVKEITGEISVQQSRIADMATSWKDEYLAIIISLPFLAVFWYALTGNPEGIQRVKDAFEAMNSLPEWYRWAFLGIIGGVFGLRGVDKFLKR